MDSSNPDTTPALAAPLGMTSNLDDPPSGGYISIIMMALYISLSTPIVLARLYTRRVIHKSLWWDDYTCVVGLIGLCGLAGIVFDSIEYGNETDQWNVSMTNAAHFKELFSYIEIVARISIFFTKLSILLLFLRIFCPPRTQRTKVFYATWAVIVFNLLYCVALVLTVLLQCVGQPKAKGQTCINSYVVLVTASIINILTDLVMLVIPIAAIYKLQMPRKRKLGICVIFAVGTLALASSVARLGYQVPRASDQNQTVLLANVTILALAEQTIGIIVSCMPILPSFYYYLRKYHSQAQSSQSHGRTWKLSGPPGDRIRSRRTGNPYAGTDLLSTDYRELDDLENGTEHGTTTTKIESAPSDEHLASKLDFEGNSRAGVLMSREVRVESFVKGEEVNTAAPERVHFRA